MKNAIGSGDIVEVTLAGTVASGAPVQIGQMFGLAMEAGVSGDVIAIARVGVFDQVPKNNTEAFTDGQLVYWDGTELRNASATGRLIVGLAVGAAASAAATATVYLDGVARADQA